MQGMKERCMVVERWLRVESEIKMARLLLDMFPNWTSVYNAYRARTLSEDAFPACWMSHEPRNHLKQDAIVPVSLALLLSKLA